MNPRITRTKKTAITKLPGKSFLKLRLAPWIYTKNGCIWLAAMAVGKSTHQINDWMNERKNKRSRLMGMFLTGSFGNKTQAIAIKQVREWMTTIPKGDSITLRCECVLSDKQFRVWKKWFQKHEDPNWHISDENKAFYYRNQS